MAHVTVQTPGINLDDPVLIEGLPGVGLVGKFAVDHLIDALDMEYYAGVYCEGVPSVAAYRTNDSRLRPPVQIYADADTDLLTLVSDVPVSPSESPEFATCVTRWLDDNDVTPVCVSGLPGSVADDTAPRSRELYGVSTGDGESLLDEAGIVPPRHAGIVTGPAGALLHRGSEIGLDGVGLVAEIDSEFPDLDAVRLVLDRGVVPITGVDVDTSPLADRDADISAVAREFAERMNDATEETTRAQPTPMFH